MNKPRVMEVDTMECCNCQWCMCCPLAEFTYGSKCTRYVMDSYIKLAIYQASNVERKEREVMNHG